MKNLLIILASFFTFQAANAQELPIDSKSKLITYTEVVEQVGSATELYEKAHRWFFSYYKNPHNVVKESADNKITARPRFKILNPKNKKGVATMGGIVNYTFTVSFKDGRYKYKITNLEWKQNSKYPIERWMDKSAKTYSPKYEYYLQQVDEEMKKVITELKNSIAKADEKKEEEW